MPYKDPDKRNEARRARYAKRGISYYEAQKKHILKWKKENKEHLSEYRKKTYDKDKELLRRQKFKEPYNKKLRKQTIELEDRYIIRQLKKEGFTSQELKQYPEFIKTKRIILKTKRLWKPLTTSQV